MENLTIINEQKHKDFYTYLLNSRLDSKMFKFIFSFLVLGALATMGMVLYLVIKDGFNFTNLQGFRDVLVFILAPIMVAASIYCLFPMTVLRGQIYRFLIPLSFLYLFIFSLPAESKDINFTSVIWIIFFFLFGFQTFNMASSLARKAFARRGGEATYQYTFSQGQFHVAVSDRRKYLDEAGEVKEEVLVREFDYQMDKVVKALVYQDTLFLHLEEGTYLIIDVTGFKETEPLKHLSDLGFPLRSIK